MQGQLAFQDLIIQHKRRQIKMGCATILFLSHFDVICDLLMNRRTETGNLFVERSANSGRPGTGVTLGLAVFI